MNENTDKAIRDADEREQGQYWFFRWGRAILLAIEVLSLGLICYSLWRR